ncbi:hypothetical protein Vretimale_1206 [Volvox reticuliferus]|uniref:Uncharacterized protein n=1 Tax=Volvox reticuliferus TaxID=1737510 RepID=A0A8J4G1L6_9CHLO|nr:hypothetical protein Vretimale_1206 [Volvox reticuliferus]
MRIGIFTVLATTLLVVAAEAARRSPSFPPPRRPPPRSPLPSPTPKSVGKKYTLVFFGDSLTDPGNVFAAGGVPDPKIYYKGRFSNGPIWTDLLAKTLQATAGSKSAVQVRNYAYGAATACSFPAIQATFPFVKDLTAQVSAFAADVKSGKARLTGTKALVFQYIGVDDFLSFFHDILATNSTPTAEAIGQMIQNTVACRVAGAAAAAAVKGVTDIVILPLAPLHLSSVVPAALKQTVLDIESVSGQATLAAMANLNNTLAAAPVNSPGAGVRIWVLGDTRWVTNGVGKVDPPFTHIEDPCFVQPVSSMVITPGIKVCTDPENYFFYDDVHPTTRFHYWFANKGVIPRLQNLQLL